jgi:hypothetical protein
MGEKGRVIQAHLRWHAEYGLQPAALEDACSNARVADINGKHGLCLNLIIQGGKDFFSGYAALSTRQQGGHKACLYEAFVKVRSRSPRPAIYNRG